VLVWRDISILGGPLRIINIQKTSIRRHDGSEDGLAKSTCLVLPHSPFPSAFEKDFVVNHPAALFFAISQRFSQTKESDRGIPFFCKYR
jgi:hypothetical protein